jgi:hypothetical protein
MVDLVNKIESVDLILDGFSVYFSYLRDEYNENTNTNSFLCSCNDMVDYIFPSSKSPFLQTHTLKTLLKDVVFIQFSKKFKRYENKTINFSNVKDCRLVINHSENIETDLTVGSLNYNVIQYKDGIANIVFR